MSIDAQALIILCDYFPKLGRDRLRKIMACCDEGLTHSKIREISGAAIPTIGRVATQYAKMNGYKSYPEMKTAQSKGDGDPVKFQVFEMCADRSDLGDIIDAVGNPAKAVTLARKFAKEQGYKNYSQYIQSI